MKYRYIEGIMPPNSCAIFARAPCSTSPRRSGISENTFFQWFDLCHADYNSLTLKVCAPMNLGFAFQANLKATNPRTANGHRRRRHRRQRRCRQNKKNPNLNLSEDRAFTLFFRTKL